MSHSVIQTWLAVFFVVLAATQSAKAVTYEEIVKYQTSGRVLGGSTFSVQVVGTTNTQAVLSYTAPDSNPCTVQVSENSSLTPLVHDVDPVLFTGSDQDSRSEAISSGGNRIFIVGERLIQTALDGNNYSRALQAYTLHYFQITCGTAVATGSFTTANIPFGMTYQDIPQLDRANPGSTIKPTLSSTDRNQTIIDPHTGALIRRVSIPGDTNQTGPFMYFGGFTRVCSNNLMGSPAIGYLCSFANGDGGYGVLYYIIPSTGEARYLGYMNQAYPFIDPINGKFFVQSGGDLIEKTYSGSYSAAAPNKPASFTSATVLSGIPAAIHAFNNNFDIAYFGCGVAPVFGDYAVFACSRGIQDTYGWIAVFQISTGKAVAAMQLYQNINYRWTDAHAIEPVYDQPAVFITTHALVGGGGVGGGPYITNYTGTSTLPIGSTILTVSGEPTCSACGVDPAIPLSQVGDSFTFGDTNETVKIVTKTSSTSWVITPTTKTHVPNAVLTAAGNYSPIFWKFLLDPNGTDATGAYVVQEPLLGGHLDITENLLLMEHWQIRVGDLFTQAGKSFTRTISESPLFAGAFAQCYGNGCASHPSAAAPGQPWLTDYLRWDGANADQGTITPISGQLYKFHSGYAPATPKQMAQAGMTGWIGGADGLHGLLDVSGPGVLLGTGAGDGYKYCIANGPGECYAGSIKGDTFVNVPTSAGTPAFKNFDAFGNGVLQIGVSGTQSRVITGGLTGLSDMNNYPTAKSLADGSWLLFTIGDTQYHTPSNLMMAKLPAFAAQDNVDRSTFVRAPITITPPAGQGIVSATVEFGYAEQGIQALRYCTSRREPCVAVSATVSDANPFSYKQSDSYTKMPCSASCTITLPVLPMHLAYYQVKYYNAGGALIGNGDYGVAAESSLANISNFSAPDITATSFTFTGPTSGNVASTSTNFTVTPVGGNFIGTISITPSGGGLSSPIVLSFSNSPNPQTFTITPTSPGSITFTPTNNGGLTNPSNLSFISNAVPSGAPTGVSAASGDTQATVTFSAPGFNGGAAIDGYTVTSSPAGGTDTNADTTGLSHLITGLTNGQAYTFTVKAHNSVGSSSASVASNIVTPHTTSFSNPAYVNSNICGSGNTYVATQNCSLSVSAGNQLLVTVYTPNSVTFSVSDGGINTYTALATGQYMQTWLVSSLATTATVTVTVSNSPGTPVTVVMEQVSGTTGVVDASNLDDGSIAGTSSGGIERFNCTTITTLTPNAYIYAVGGQRNGFSLISSATMTGVSVNDTGTSQIGTGGRVAFGHQTTTSVVTVAPIFNEGPDYNTEPTHASCYVVALKPNIVISVPDAPVIGTATAGNAQATVTFTAPGFNGGASIDGYTVSSSPAGGTDTNAGSTGLLHIVTGLTNGTQYTFTVTAHNTVGNSSASAASSPIAPNLPGTASFTFTGSSSGSLGSASTNFTVTPVGGNYTGTVTITPSGTGSTGLSPIVLTFSNSSTAQTFTITPTVTGSITLTASNNGSLTNPDNLTYTVNAVLPGAPSIGTATAGNSQAAVTFTAPVSNGGAVIDGYTVTSLPAGGVDSNSGTTGLSHLVTGLTNGTSYTFTVTAHNSVGNSVASSASNAVVPVASSKAITTFNFTSPTVTGAVNEGVHTISLTVPFGTNVTALVPTITTTGVSVSPNTGVAQNFTAPVTYTVTAADTTTQSYAVTVIVAPLTTPAISVISSGTPSDTSSTITWTTNISSNSQVEYGTTTIYASSSTLDSTLATSHSVILSGLSASTEYHFRVLSSNGDLAVSTDQTFTTAATPAPPSGGGGGGGGGGITFSSIVTNFKATAGNTQILLSWTNPSYPSFTTLALVRKSGTSTPASLQDGIKVFQGAGQSFTDTGLTNGQIYSYTLFPLDASGTILTPVITIQAAPQENLSLPVTTSTSSPLSSGLPIGLTMPTSAALPFSTGSLVNDHGTIYFISQNITIPFTSLKAFLGLGYSLKNVINGDTSAYTKAGSFELSSPTQEHPWGSFLSYRRTVYYFIDKGLIPVPSAEIFLSNGGDFNKVVPMSIIEINFLKTRSLPNMEMNDPRVKN